MRVRADPTALNPDIAVPRPVARQKSYRGLAGQASTSSGSSCGSLACLEDRIEEESEESEMVLGGPASDRTDERAEYDSDKDDEDDDLAQEPVAREIGPQLPGVFDEAYHPQDDALPRPGIIVTLHSDDDVPSSSAASSDNLLLIQLRAREYRGNFDGFAEINRFGSIEEMHEFIVNNSDASTGTTTSSEPSAKQTRYLDILLKEKPQDRFSRLVETSRGAVRRILGRNEHILADLFAAASLENFPSPLTPRDSDDAEDDEDDEEDRDENIAEVEENMKRWYMIEMIGIWLKLVTDVRSYREAIKMSVLKASCGIENDRYEGIAVPLKYK